MNGPGQERGTGRALGGTGRSSGPVRDRAASVLESARALRNWGSTGAERSMALPGDELVPAPADQTTRAVGVDAPAEVVWSWLVQIGQDRGGMYSYDRLENLLGLHIHSADRIREEWQHLAVGDRVRLVPPGWMGMKAGVSLPVALVDPPRSLVLREQPPEFPWDAVWSFHVLEDGPQRVRLVSRGRSARRGPAARVAAAAMDPVTLVMTRRMLLGIRDRAERRRGPTARPA